MLGINDYERKKLNFVRTYSEQASDKSNDQKSSFGAVRFIHFSFSIWTVELDQGSNKGNRWPDQESQVTRHEHFEE